MTARPGARDGAQPVGADRALVAAPTVASLPLSRLAPEAAVRSLELTVARRLDGLLQGDHRGLLPGPGSEVNDARRYEPGQDDVRMIDWAVTARTTVPHVRDTIADRELETWAVLDATPSMNWGTTGLTKRDLGIAAIATLGLLSLNTGDRFGAMVLRPDRLRRVPARTGRRALLSLLRGLLAEPIVADDTPGTLDLAAGLDQMLAHQRRRGLRLVVSDFQDAGEGLVDPSAPAAWEAALRRMAVRQQVIAVEVVDSREVHLPDVGELQMRDPETGFVARIDTSSRRTRERMDVAAAARRERVRLALRRAGAAHLQLRTDRDWVADIARFVAGHRRMASMLHAPPPGVTA